MTLGHTDCTCAQANPGASDEVREQVFKHVMNNFKIVMTIALVLRIGEPRGKASETSQLYHKPRDNLKSAKKKRQSQHS